MWGDNFNAVETVTGILAWGFIIFLAYRVYKKQNVKPKKWKVLIVMIVGLFSFSINWHMSYTQLKLPILPLGVWILYFILKGKDERWQAYRSFAWLGFLANFIFLASTFISISVHHLIYSKNDPTTYISTIEDAFIMNIHPSAKNHSLNIENLKKELNTLKQERILNNQWYEYTYMNSEPNQRNERFPYMLMKTSPKWGSGLNPIIYIEDDGKGILITTSQKQLYFRSENLLIKGGE